MIPATFHPLLARLGLTLVHALWELALLAGLAWLGLVGCGAIVFTYWGVNFLLSGLHAYAR